MSKVVEEGEYDGKELLDAHNTLERPFPVVLDYGLQHRRIPREPSIGNNMLAGIIAFGWAIPEKEPEV